MSTEQGAKGDPAITRTEEYLPTFTAFQRRQILINKIVFLVRLVAVVLATVGMGLDEVSVMVYAITLMLVASALRDD